VDGAGSDRSKPREQLPEQKRRALEPAKSSATKTSKPIRRRRFQPLTRVAAVFRACWAGPGAP